MIVLGGSSTPNVGRSELFQDQMGGKI